MTSSFHIYMYCHIMGSFRGRNKFRGSRAIHECFLHESWACPMHLHVYESSSILRKFFSLEYMYIPLYSNHVLHVPQPRLLAFTDSGEPLFKTSIFIKICTLYEYTVPTTRKMTIKRYNRMLLFNVSTFPTAQKC